MSLRQGLNKSKAESLGNTSRSTWLWRAGSLDPYAPMYAFSYKDLHAAASFSILAYSFKRCRVKRLELDFRLLLILSMAASRSIWMEATWWLSCSLDLCSLTACILLTSLRKSVILKAQAFIFLTVLSAFQTSCQEGINRNGRSFTRA